MAYMKIIESTSTWTCPKTADYKVICVAGGQSGAENASAAANDVAVVSGGSTSFGSHLTASGNWDPNPSLRSTGQRGGMGGYTLISYGGSGGDSPVNNGGISGLNGIGYGAGGFGGGGSYGGRSGACGKLMMTIVTITAGTNITCTIGKGGISPNSSKTGSGNDGVIVIQEV